MANFIMDNFKGCEVTLAVTGLPVTVTGEVMNCKDVNENVITLRLENGNKININAKLIAFIF